MLSAISIFFFGGGGLSNLTHHQPAFYSHAISVNSPYLMANLLTHGQRHYREGFTVIRDPGFTELHENMFGGHSIGGAAGDEWKWRRKLMVPFFQPRKIVELLPFAVERTNMVIDHLRGEEGLKGMDINNLMNSFTFDIICKHLFGRMGPQELDFESVGGYENIGPAFLNLTNGFIRSLPWTLLPLIGRTNWAHEPARTARMRLRKFIRVAILRCMADEDVPGAVVPVTKMMAREPQFDPNTEEGIERLITEMLVLIFAGTNLIISRSYQMDLFIFSLIAFPNRTRHDCPHSR